jgi:hypothetical protein
MQSDDTAISQLVAYSLDLLSQAEAQERASRRTHAEVTAFADACAGAQPTARLRQKCLDGIVDSVGELRTVVEAQAALMVDIHETVSTLRARLRM